MSKISELSDGGSLVSTDYLIAVRSGGNVKVRMDEINVDQVDLGDNEFIRLGNSQDLTLVHNASNSIINQAGIGDLLIQKAGSTKLTVNATGIDVTGTATMDGLTVDGDAGFNTASPNAYAHIVPTDAELNDKFIGFRVSRSLSLKSAQYGTINQSGGSLTLLSTVTTNAASGSVRLLSSADGSTTKNLANFTNNNDVSFYEDTGTTAKFFWDASAESLGINTISPVRNLHISSASAEIMLEDSDGGSDDKRVTLKMNNGIFSLNSRYDNDTERLSNIFVADIGSGNVGIGTSSPSATLEVDGVTNSTYLIVGGDDSSNGRALTFTSSASAAFNGAVHTINAPSSQGVIALSTGSTERMRIDSSGHAIIPAGVTLGTAAGVYAAANTLDDYEEGTWTPSLEGSTTGGSHTYGYQNGKYTKVGNTVTASFGMYITTKDNTMNGNVLLSGLPVSASMGTNVFANLAIGWAANITYGDMLGGYINSGTSIALRLNNSAAAGGFLQSSAIGSGSVYLFGTITYQV